MTTLDLHPWNFMPTEILEHIFSFLPVRDRHNVSQMCKLWATAVSSPLVWSFTEVHCDSEETDMEQEAVVGVTSNSLLQKIQPFMGHIRYLKLVLDRSLKLNWRLACIILDEMALKSHRLQGLQIVCYGRNLFFYSGQDVLQSLRRLFQGMVEETMQHVDFRKMPFGLDNGLTLLVARCSPNLRTLLINNCGPPMVQPNTIVEVLRSCPKLSTLGIFYVALSRRMFWELLKPNREPFILLELFHNGFENDIPDYCWSSVRERHLGFHVRLEFAATVTMQEMTEVLKPHVPIFELRFNSLTHMATHMKLVTKLYARTLEKLVVHSGPYTDLNVALIKLARACSNLKEIHCFCQVSQGVVEAFRHHCPHLEKYTLSLSPTMFSCDNPPMVLL